MPICTTLLCLVVALAIAALAWVKQRYTFWKRRGIPQDKPQFPSGSMTGYMKTRTLRDIMKDYYDKFKGTGPFAGFYFCLTPAVVVLDLDLARDILIKDFHNFTDRGLYHNAEDDPLTENLFGLDGEKWRRLRNKLSPTFTSGKMKFMFPTVVAVGEKLYETLNQMIEVDALVEIKDLMTRYTVDVIGTCAFGIECNSLNDPNAEFRVMGRKAFTLTRHNSLIIGLMFSFPNLARKLHMRYVHEEVHQFFMRAVRETVEFREKHSVKRNDFMNLLIDMKSSDEGMSIGTIAAQCFVFFAAGFESASTTLSFALFEMAINQDIQDKLRAEINETLERHQGNFTYESMMELHYMEKVIKETLRKYTIVINIMRKCWKDYRTADPRFTIPKDSLVLIPADCFHRDPDIYPDPERFDPERFIPEEIQKRHPAAWLAFGDGPRNCIGLRFGKMQMVVGLVMLLRKFKFHYSDQTPYPLEFDAQNPFVGTKGGIFLRVERIQ